jgi:hypothetical protein
VEKQFKGNMSFTDITIPEDRDLVGWLEGHSVTGYRIKIFCSKVRYRKQYSRWYVPSTEIDLYHVYSVVSDDAPEPLKEACSLEIIVPPPHREFISAEFQKDTAIEWYLDLLIQRIARRDCFNA